MKYATYGVNRLSFTDKIVVKKRLEIVSIINSLIRENNLISCLDIGTTSDERIESSNIVVKLLKGLKIKKSLSNQDISINLFDKIFKKSITNDFTQKEINKLSSDLVLSIATIEHVGNFKNQKKMLENIVKMTDQYFVFTTPNRYFPIDFHAKLPFLHWLPKSIHRFVLKTINLRYFSYEQNLNLLSKNDLETILKFKNVYYTIKKIELFGLTSNFLVIGKIIKNENI